MAITRVGTGTVGYSSVQTGTGSASITLNKPTGIANGDVLLASIVYKDTSLPSAAPSGWTRISAIDSSINNGRHLVYYKVITNAGSEPASYTWTVTSSKGAGVLGAYRGVNNSAPIEGYYIYSNTSFLEFGVTYDYSLGTYDPVYKDNCWIISFAAAGAAGTWTIGNPYTSTTSTKQLDVTSSGGGSSTSKVALALGDGDLNTIATATAANAYNSTNHVYNFVTNFNLSATESSCSGLGVVLAPAGATISMAPVSIDGTGDLQAAFKLPHNFSYGKNTSYEGAAYYTGLNDYWMGWYASVGNNLYPNEKPLVNSFKNLTTNDYTKYSDEISTVQVFNANYTNTQGVDDMFGIRVSNNTVCTIHRNHQASDGTFPCKVWQFNTVKLDSSTGTVANCGGFQWGGSNGSGCDSTRGRICRLGDNSVIGWFGSYATGGTDYKWRVVTLDPTTRAPSAGTPIYPDGTNRYFGDPIFTSHVDGTKAVVYYYLPTSVYGLRVVNVSGNTMTLGANSYQVANQGTPYAIDSTTGYLVQVVSSPLPWRIIFQKYTISGDVITFENIANSLTITPSLATGYTLSGIYGTQWVQMDANKIAFVYVLQYYDSGINYYSTMKVANLSYSGGVLQNAGIQSPTGYSDVVNFPSVIDATKIDSTKFSVSFGQEYPTMDVFQILTTLTPTKTFEVDAYLVRVKKHTIDAALKGVISKLHTVDADLLKTGITKAHTVDAKIIATPTNKSHTVDSKLIFNGLKPHIVTAYINPNPTSTKKVKPHEVDALLKFGYKRHTVDASIAPKVLVQATARYYAYQNVGFNLTRTPNGYGYLYENVGLGGGPTSVDYVMGFFNSQDDIKYIYENIVTCITPRVITYSTGTGANGGTFTVPAPSGLQSGDLLLLFWRHGNDSTSVSGGSTWTQIENHQGSGTLFIDTSVWAKLCGGSEPSSYTLTTGGTGSVEVMIVLIRDVDQTTPILGHAWNLNANTNNHPCPAVTVGAVTYPVEYLHTGGATDSHTYGIVVAKNGSGESNIYIGAGFGFNGFNADMSLWSTGVLIGNYGRIGVAYEKKCGL